MKTPNDKKLEVENKPDEDAEAQGQTPYIPKLSKTQSFQIDPITGKAYLGVLDRSSLPTVQYVESLREAIAKEKDITNLSNLYEEGFKKNLGFYDIFPEGHSGITEQNYTAAKDYYRKTNLDYREGSIAYGSWVGGNVVAPVLKYSGIGLAAMGTAAIAIATFPYSVAVIFAAAGMSMLYKSNEPQKTVNPDEVKYDNSRGALSLAEKTLQSGVGPEMLNQRGNFGPRNDFSNNPGAPGSGASIYSENDEENRRRQAAKLPEFTIDKLKELLPKDLSEEQIKVFAKTVNGLEPIPRTNIRKNESNHELADYGPITETKTASGYRFDGNEIGKESGDVLVRIPCKNADGTLSSTEFDAMHFSNGKLVNVAFGNGDTQLDKTYVAQQLQEAGVKLPLELTKQMSEEELKIVQESKPETTVNVNQTKTKGETEDLEIGLQITDDVEQKTRQRKVSTVSISPKADNSTSKKVLEQEEDKFSAPKTKLEAIEEGDENEVDKEEDSKTASGRASKIIIDDPNNAISVLASNPPEAISKSRVEPKPTIPAITPKATKLVVVNQDASDFADAVLKGDTGTLDKLLTYKPKLATDKIFLKGKESALEFLCNDLMIDQIPNNFDKTLDTLTRKGNLDLKDQSKTALIAVIDKLVLTEIVVSNEAKGKFPITEERKNNILRGRAEMMKLLIGKGLKPTQVQQENLNKLKARVETLPPRKKIIETETETPREPEPIKHQVDPKPKENPPPPITPDNGPYTFYNFIDSVYNGIVGLAKGIHDNLVTPATNYMSSAKKLGEVIESSTESAATGTKTQPKRRETNSSHTL